MKPVTGREAGGGPFCLRVEMMVERQTKRTPNHARTRANRETKKARFLKLLAERGVVGHACAEVGIDRVTAYEWRQKDSAFAAKWAKALEDSTDTLEAEAWRRAQEGTKRPVYQGGRRVGYVQEYSDDLMKFLLRAHHPRRFAELSRTEHSGPDGGPIAVDLLNVRRRAAADLEAFEKGKHASRKPKAE